LNDFSYRLPEARGFGLGLTSQGRGPLGEPAVAGEKLENFPGGRGGKHRLIKIDASSE